MVTFDVDLGIWSMCNFNFCNKYSGVEAGEDTLHLFTEEIRPNQQHSRLSCAALFFWLTKVLEVSYLTSSDVSLLRLLTIF